jgi:hypothetical protein
VNATTEVDTEAAEAQASSSASSSSSLSLLSSVSPLSASSVVLAARRRITRLDHVDTAAVLTALDPDPAALEHLSCDFAADPRDEPEDDGDDPDANDGNFGQSRSLADLVTRFTQLRYLGVSCRGGIDGAFLRAIGERLPLLEFLWLSRIQFDDADAEQDDDGDDDGDADTDAGGGGGGATRKTKNGRPRAARGSDRYFAPLRRLARLRDLQLAWNCDAAHSAAVELPSLPALTALSARYTHWSTAHVAERCPNLVYLAPPRDIASDSGLAAAARLPHLTVICVEYMLRVDEETPFWRHHSDTPDFFFSPQHLEHLLHARRTNGIAAKLVARVPWPHDHGHETAASGSAAVSGSAAATKRSAAAAVAAVAGILKRLKMPRAPTNGDRDDDDDDDDSGVRLILCGVNSTAELAVVSRHNTDGDCAAIVRLTWAVMLVAAVLGIAWNFGRRPWQ